MEKELKKHLRIVNEALDTAEMFQHAHRLVDFDRQTVCPPKGLERQGEIGAFLGNRAFTILKDKKFIKSAEVLYKNRADLGKYDSILAGALHRNHLRTGNITPKTEHRFSLVYSKAFSDWINAREKSDFTLFRKALRAVRDTDLERVSLMRQAKENTYDNLLDLYERGMTSATLDETFGLCKERLIPLLQKIQSSSRTIRTDFMKRPVTDFQQQTLARYLLDVMRFDFSRGAFALSEHPFTEDVSRNDIRVTTHYYPNHFVSSMYSVIHEGGHALFAQLTPEAHHKHHISGEKTLGMHESVSRFYENRIGRSEAFIHLIYARIKEIMPDVLHDVSEKELYEAVNRVKPTLIRTDADEFTYTFHIIIRYEIEQAIIGKKIKIDDIPRLWADKYEEYLGIRPANDREGVLQDVHWASGFGYFPTYALGNMYNAMYCNTMRKKNDIDKLVAEGHLDIVNEWMTKHVFKKADRMDAPDWIRDITGQEFSPKAFLDYLEEKYGALYGL
ncbi:MAG: carboxypeptidase M32 [Lachnospiraceae bacterium]|nr:carboxypeptidase M32 [Lachnospiraceae bacterium]